MYLNKETWRGWQGHWCIAARWHLNTLLDFGDKKIIVSTNGEGYNSLNEDFTTSAGGDFMYETMVFESKYDKWDDADITKQYHEFTRRYVNEEEAQSGHYQIIELVKQNMRS